MPEAGGYRRRSLIVLAAAATAGLGALPFSLSTSSNSPRRTRAYQPYRTYYLDPAGSDDADGLSPGSAWRSLDRVRGIVLAPGDTLLLRGGARFTGSLLLDRTHTGSSATPVKIGSFGSGRAIIQAQAAPAVYVHNTAGIEIRDLVAIGGEAAYTGCGGIVCYNDLPDTMAGGRRLEHLVIAGVEASGFKNGIEIGAVAAGFSGVTISDARVHDNMEAGLTVYGPRFEPSRPRYAHQNVTVSSVEAFRNAGDPSNAERNTGNGIVFGSVHTGRIENSTAYENGVLCAAPEGPAGIWTYDSTAMVIERNVAHHNRTGGQADGDGFDLDQNTSDCVLQDNLAYANDGAGLLLYAEKAGTYNRNNIVRNNVSTSSPGNSEWYGGITVAGQVTGARIYGNTVTVSAAGRNRPPVVRLAGTLTGVVMSDNRLISDDAGPVIAAQDGADASAIVQAGNQLVGSSKGVGEQE